MRLTSRSVISILLLCAGVALAQDPSDRFYQAIRNNDLTTLRALVKTAGVNVKDQRETTPLMYAAAYGSLDAMKLLLAAGADVNAKNAFDATALLWSTDDLAKVRLLAAKGANVNAPSKQGRTPLLVAASHDGSSEVVKLLLAKGADINVQDAAGITPLMAATDANDTASVALLLEKGAKVEVKVSGNGGTGVVGMTPLMNAAANGNAAVVKMLLAKGAGVDAVSAADGMQMKNGPLALGSFTPLLLVAAYGGSDTVKLLLDAGAKVNVQDVRGMTPIMLAVSTDHPDMRVIRLLMDKGADPKIKSKLGESTLDWARKLANPPVLEALGLERIQAAATPPIQPVAEEKLATPRDAAAKGIAILQRASAGFFREGGCVSCHAQNLTGMAISAARANGIPVDETASAEQVKAVKLQWASFEQVLLQRLDPPGEMDTIMYSVLDLSAEGAPADRAIDAMVANLASEQRSAGHWHLGGLTRPPMEDGDFSRTAICLRALASYSIPGRKAEFDQRIQRAASWLKAAHPRTTEDRTMQLLGLKWANTDRRGLDATLKDLMALQRSDGGWSQTPDLASDAYATGEVLYTLHELGVPPSDAAYQRGAAYLLKTQLADGSWYVKSRAPKFQPYFQSGFPHDHDQWISSSATAWATMALSYAAGTKPTTVAAR